MRVDAIDSNFGIHFVNISFFSCESFLNYFKTSRKSYLSKVNKYESV